MRREALRRAGKEEVAVQNERLAIDDADAFDGEEFVAGGEACLVRDGLGCLHVLESHHARGARKAAATTGLVKRLDAAHGE